MQGLKRNGISDLSAAHASHFPFHRPFRVFVFLVLVFFVFCFSPQELCGLRVLGDASQSFDGVKRRITWLVLVVEQSPRCGRRLSQKTSGSGHRASIEELGRGMERRSIVPYRQHGPCMTSPTHYYISRWDL